MIGERVLQAVVAVTVAVDTEYKTLLDVVIIHIVEVEVVGPAMIVYVLVTVDEGDVRVTGDNVDKFVTVAVDVVVVVGVIVDVKETVGVLVTTTGGPTIRLRLL